MTYSLLLFASRKPGLSLEDFKTYNENTHVPLLKAQAGDLFPLSHTRRYIARASDDNASNTEQEPNAATPAIVFVGSPKDMAYDVVVETIFKDENHCKAFMGVMMDPEKVKAREQDEERFLNRASIKLVLLGETLVTKGKAE